ncbi:hypothetical protein DITRI_Ditri15bG0042800 [Diplodiscus trichospermus]
MLDSLIQTLSRLDKGLPHKDAFDLLIARLCKLQRTEESLHVIETMAEGGYGLNEASFHPIVSSLMMKKKIGEAWRVVDRMRNVEVALDVTMYNYLLIEYCFKMKLSEASAVVKKIEEEGLAVDSRTYDALILGACGARKVEGALVLLRSMMDARFHVMYSTHSHVINGMLRLGYYNQVVRFVMACRGKDPMLDKEIFRVLANKLVSLGRPVEAMVVLDEMRKRGMTFGEKLTEFYEQNVQNRN